MVNRSPSHARSANINETPLHWIETSVRVRYAETDQMGHVYYANYLVWFEVGRGAFCRVRGIDYSALEREGYGLPVVEVHCRYLRPAFYDDDIAIRLCVTECRRSVLRMRYEIRRDDDLLATGETLQMLVEKTSGKPRSFPMSVLAQFVPKSTED